jgi:hypothetical protein
LKEREGEVTSFSPKTLGGSAEPPCPTDELRQTVRAEIEKNRRCDDKQKIKFLISEGLQRLKGLDEMLDMTGNS